MTQEDLFPRLAVALAIGLLIGLERGWHQREDAEGERTAGLRTYALSGLLGGICGALSPLTGPMTFALTFASFTAAFTLFSWFEATTERDFSVTGVIAGMLTFALGAYAVLGHPTVAVAAAVAMAGLLALKQPLHSWLRKLTWLELRAVLILLAMSFLLLPVLPNRPIDPWGAINPTEIWMFAILIAGISFAGYVAVRTIGEETGIAVAAVAGGVTSSTATTLSFARMAREHPKAARMLAGGILIAGVTMLVRLVVLAGVVNPNLVMALAIPAGAAAIALVGASAWLLLRPDGIKGERSGLNLKNPFDLSVALKFAALIALIMLLAKALIAEFGSSGLYLLAAVSGIADVDALTLSVSRLAGGQVSLADAVTAILLAAGVNTVAKAAMAAWIGGKQLGMIVGAASALAIAAAVVAYLATAQLSVLPSPIDL